MSRDERAWASVKIGFLVLPALLSPGRCGGEYGPPLYWKCLFFIARESWLYLAAPGGAAQRALARGIAQAVTRHRPTWISKLKLKFEVESQIHGGDGRNGKVEAIVVAERIAPQSVPGCRLSRSDKEVRQEGTMDVAAKVEVAALTPPPLTKTTQRVVSSAAAGSWSLTVIERGWTCSAPRIWGTFTNHMQIKPVNFPNRKC